MSDPAASPAAQVPEAPTSAELEQLEDAKQELERLLLERSLRRIAALMLDYEPAAKVLFVEVDSFLDYEPTGWSRDERLGDPHAAESLEEYRQIENAAGTERELEGLVANLHDWDTTWRPYTRFQHPDSGRYSLDLAAMRTASIPPRPRAANWWSVIGTDARPDAPAEPWTELVRAHSAQAAARIAEERRRQAAQRTGEPGPGPVPDPRTYAVFAGAVAPAAHSA